MGVGQKEVLWNQGENVGQLDLNNMQHFLRAFSTDWMLGQAGSFQGFGTVGAANYDRSKALYSYGDSGAPFPSATNLTIDTLGGPLIHWQTGPTFPLASNAPPANWGSDPYALYYWLAPNELQTQHPAGDPTNPRWDMLCVKLNDVSNDLGDRETRLQRVMEGGVLVTSENTFVKRRKVTLSSLLVVGTPAVSPTIPAVPAGYLPYYAILVPALFNSTFPVDDNFHDYRMPLGSFCVDVIAAEALTLGYLSFPGGTIPASFSLGFITGTNGIFAEVAVTSDNLHIIPRLPISPHSCRLVGISQQSGSATQNFTVSLQRYDISIGLGFTGFGGNSHWTFSALGSGAPSTDNIWISTALANSAGNDPPSADAKPPWASGRPSGYASRRDRLVASNLVNSWIGLKYTTGASPAALYMTRFHFAGMPF